MNTKWGNITADDVKKAIELFSNSIESYPEPRNTFLVYNGKKYPAKHIRGLAFYIANGREISKSEYNGGQETVNFFERLNFIVEYKKQSIGQLTENTNSKKYFTKRKTQKKLNPVDQKNALQILFQKHFGVIETEKKFDWLKTPNHDNLPKEYSSISNKLLEYRNQNGFQKSNYQLLCDIVLENHKLIIEYDENQHFSKARQITLENYPKNVELYFSKKIWIDSCEKINAKDNSPIDRDEKRAFYDAVRDIEAYKHGYKLIRIKHGDFDWESENADEELKSLVNNSMLNQDVSFSHHKIARLIVTEKDYHQDGTPIFFRLENLLERFISSEFGKRFYEFIITPGGFLKFSFPVNLQYNLDIAKTERDNISSLQNEAEKYIFDFLGSLNKSIYEKLKETASFLTIGIDGFNPINNQTIELVGILDLSQNKLIKWTGKFYPTNGQKKNLIKINNLDSHFIRLNNQNILVLGCHDLKVFSPRGQAVAAPNGWKKQTADKFRSMCKEFMPTIVLQHPHNTDTPKIWNIEWRVLEKELPSVVHFASGINYSNKGQRLRDTLSNVLVKTKMGDVQDFK